MRTLIDKGVTCRRGIPPIHLEPLYRRRAAGDDSSLPVTEAVAAQSIFLPMYASLDESDQARVIDGVLRAVGR
jgi:dTDP-4-amino-4,6-dideoxygalactose transaminase